jgi:hypothetical protein
MLADLLEPQVAEPSLVSTETPPTARSAESQKTEEVVER